MRAYKNFYYLCIFTAFFAVLGCSSDAVSYGNDGGIRRDDINLDYYSTCPLHQMPKSQSEEGVIKYRRGKPLSNLNEE